MFDFKVVKKKITAPWTYFNLKPSTSIYYIL